MRAMYIKVRARSANEGSGTVGWSLATLVPSCFLMDEEDIADLETPGRVAPVEVETQIEVNFTLAG